jgi:hypothetical protein
MVESLDKREAEIIKLRFGLDGRDELTLEEVGQKFHVTRERIRQLEYLARVVRGLDGEAEAALLAVDLDDAGGDLLAGLEHVLDLLDALLADLRDVHETVDVVLELHEGAEAGDLGDGALTTSPILKKASMSDHGSVGELLHAEADALLALSTSSTMASTSSPFLRTSDGWLTLRVQLMSETCTMPSMPSSSSMKAP